jgi:hypothetical protein
MHLPVNAGILRDLIVELSLMYFGLAERLTIRAADGPKIQLTPSDREFGEVTTTSALVAVGLSQQQLESCLAYLLRYERDGAADVQHLDVEVGDEARFTLVFVGSDITEPMSADEANRALGIEEDSLDDYF